MNHLATAARKSRAFTLIELLVVIAIIAILAAILFPVFAQAKLAAKKASDLSNIKQTALGILIYTNDSDDVYPLSYFYDVTFATPYSNSYAWSSKLGVYPYLKSTALYKSPADSISLAHNNAYYGIDASRTQAPQSLMANAVTPAYFMFGVSNPQGLMPSAPSMPPFFGSTQNAVTTSTTAPPEPSKIVMLAGGYKEFLDGVWYCNEWNNSEIDWCYTGYGVTEQYVVDALTLATPSSNVYPGWRKFSGSSNFAFSDGSAKSLRPGDLRDPARWIINPAPTSNP